jgi:hypothetical protein
LKVRIWGVEGAKEERKEGSRVSTNTKIFHPSPFLFKKQL